MRFNRSLFAVLLAAVVSVVGLVPRSAHAAPCCSAPICQKDNPPAICASCGDCVGESDDGIDYEHDFDDSAGVCYAVNAL